VNLRSRRSEGRRRHLYLCDPVGAVHLELPEETEPDPDAPDPRHDPEWGRLAEETRAWARARGIAVAAPVTS